MTSIDEQHAAVLVIAGANPNRFAQQNIDAIVMPSMTVDRLARGGLGTALMCVAFGRPLFQLWNASPIPESIGWGVLNDTHSRSIHFGFVLLLGVAAFPATQGKFQIGPGIAVPLVFSSPPSRC